MSNYSKLYWLTRVDVFHDIILTICILSIVSVGITLLWCTLNAGDDDYSWNKGEIDNRRLRRIAVRKKWIPKFVTTFIITLAVIAFMPTKSDVIFIVAGGKTMDFVQADTSINKIPAQTTKIITDFLQKQIDGAKDKDK